MITTTTESDGKQHYNNRFWGRMLCPSNSGASLRTQLQCADKNGDNTTTTDDNYDDCWNTKKNKGMEHNIMAAGANRNRNTATHTQSL